MVIRAMLLPGDVQEARLIDQGRYLDLLRGFEDKAVLTQEQKLIKQIAQTCLFVQLNWTGPPLRDTDIQELKATFNTLTVPVDGEVVTPCARHLELLFSDEQSSTSTFLHDWWALRRHILHQRLLDNPSNTLHTKIFSIIDKYKQNESMNALFCVEVSLICIFYDKDHDAMEWIDRACKQSGFEFKLGGRLGRRLRTQTFDVTQLTLEVSTKSKDCEHETASVDEANSVLALPERVKNKLQDDVSVIPTSISGSLRVIDALILLAWCHALIHFNPRGDESVKEQVRTVLEHELVNFPDWSIRTAALYLECSLQQDIAKEVERAALQLQALEDQVTGRYSDSSRANNGQVPVFDRLVYYFYAPVPNRWQLQSAQGRLFAGLGMFKTACKLFEDAHAWEEAVQCMMQLGDKVRGEAKLKALLNEANQPLLKGKLLCILGDLTGDRQCYEQAWNEYRVPRAQRTLGRLYYMESQWQKAIDAFEISLSINPLFAQTWFLLGNACLEFLKLQKHEEGKRLLSFKNALRAFARAVSIEPEHVDALASLGQCHLLLDEPKQAIEALTRAVKLRWEDVRLWSLLSDAHLEAGDSKLALTCLERILDAKGHESDTFQLIEHIKKIIMQGASVKQVMTSHLWERMDETFPGNTFWGTFKAQCKTIQEND